MKRSFLLVLILLLMLVTPVYAGGLPEDISSLNAGESSIERTGSSGVLSSMDIFAGQNAILKMKADKSAGYTWEIAEPWDEKIVELVGKESMASTSAGALGAEVWTFKAIKPGTVNIAFRYVDSTGASAPESQNAVFAINVKEGVATKSVSSMEQLAPRTMTGNVESVQLSGAATRVNPAMIVKGDDGKTVEFVVKPLCYVTRGASGQVSFSQVTSGARVTVNYRVGKNGDNEAVAIAIE